MPTRLEVEISVRSREDILGLIRVSPALLPETAHRYCFFQISENREDIKRGDYALVDLDADINPGDRVITFDEYGSNSLMRANKSDHGWTFAPLRRSPLTPWFVEDVTKHVIGKVVRTFSMGENLTPQ